MNPVSSTRQSVMLSASLFLGGIIQLSFHFSSSTLYLLSLTTPVHLRLDNSEQDIRTYSNRYPGRSGNIPLRNQEKRKINHDGKIFLN
jgi:hypothetical protein